MPAPRKLWQLDEDLRQARPGWPAGKARLRRELLGLAVRGMRQGIDDDQDLGRFIERQYLARHDDRSAGIDPTTLILIAKIVLLLLEWWRENRAERWPIVADLEGV